MQTGMNPDLKKPVGHIALSYSAAVSYTHLKQKYYSTGKELSKEDWEILAESKSRRLIEILSLIHIYIRIPGMVGMP